MYLTFDVGTTSMKTTVFNDRFETSCSHSCEYSLLYPAEGIVESDPLIYWRALKEGIAFVLHAGIHSKDIKSVTITTQGETLIPIGHDGNSLCNAIVWLDTRAHQEADALYDTISHTEFHHTTGMPDLGPASPIAKLMWIRKNWPDLYEKTAYFLLLEDYLIYQLTGECVTEYSLLSSTGYFDINNNRYWQKILDAAGISLEKLPKALPCATIAGYVTALASADCGLQIGTPVVTGAMDQIASAVGAGNVHPGVISETTGTCLVLASTIRKPDYKKIGHLSIYKHFDNQYICLPYNPTAGIIIKWFKETFMDSLEQECAKNGGSVYQRMDEMAEMSSPGARGLTLIPHFLGKLIPDFNVEAKGVFYGIGLHHERKDFIRAILESVGYMLYENISCLEKSGIKVSEIRSLGGGSRSNVWTRIKADICGKKLVTMEESESASLGAAILGAFAIGRFKSVQDICDQFVRPRLEFYPNDSNRVIYDKGYKVYCMIYQALADVYKF